VTDRADADRILLSAAVIADLKQFDKLRRAEPPLSIDDIAHRMAWPKKDVKWLLKKMKDTRS
jgi:hypothetical protein